MDIDLQVKFESMKIQTTLHKNIPHMRGEGALSTASQILEGNVSSRNVKATMLYL